MNDTLPFRILAVILGLVLGSFYNVCIHRTVSGESVVDPPRSKCPLCGRTLTWWENIPLLSYALLRGRCHGCKAPISPRYPLVEALSGLICLALAVRFGPGLKFVAYTGFCGLLLVLAFIDLATMTLPLYPMIAGAAAALACAPLVLDIPLSDAALAAALGAGGFWLVRFLYKRLRGVEGLGEGDIWLMLLIGPLVGVANLPFVVMVSGVGLILASVVMLRHRPDTFEDDDIDYDELSALQTPVPYGPFLCAAAVLAILWGRDVLMWYLRVV
ncbi:prepilin peptidase [Desulfocurvus sp. DL9XJH121]